MAKGKRKGFQLTKKTLPPLLLCGTGVALLLVCAAAAYLRAAGLREAEALAPVTLVEFSPIAPQVARFDTAPEPTPEPVKLPYGAVDICVDGVAVAALYSQADAEAVLSEQLRVQAVAPEGEQFLSASYACDIRIGGASGAAPLMEAGDALALLLDDPALVPVTVVTQLRTADTGKAQSAETSDAGLYRGERMIAQLGTGARTVTHTQRTYTAGVLTDAGDPTSQIVSPARTTRIRQGTYRSASRTGIPDSDEGVPGKRADGLKLQTPLRGTLSSYFGIRGGNMHNGVDIAAKAGTPVSAPGEGLVVYCGTRGEYGFVVDIDHGNGFVSRLTHLDAVSVELHQRVYAGNPVGTLAEADSAAPHLHYELIVDGVPVNPLFYLS